MGDQDSTPTSDQNIWDKLGNLFNKVPWAPVMTAVVVLGAMVFVARTLTADGNHLDVRDNAYARGFITVLFGVGTIGIALILILSAIFLTDDKAKERFDRGKEVLSLLLGIFGTIVGFYYGTGAPTVDVDMNPRDFGDWRAASRNRHRAVRARKGSRVRVGDV